MNETTFVNSSKFWTLDDAEGQSRLGIISEEQFEAFMCAWRISVPRASSLGRRFEVPSTVEVQRLAALVLGAAGVEGVAVPSPVAVRAARSLCSDCGAWHY